MEQGQLVQDRYVLDHPLGTGGMAEVWRARDDRLGRSVAIKFLAPRLASDPEFLVRFFSEAQSVARISHRNVVDVLDFGKFEERPYLVMEFVPGGTLTDLVGEPLPPERAFTIVEQVASGLGAAHAIGLVHRDVKPGNILIDESGEAKIADFGISSADGAEKLTATGAAIGSPHYISPEQVSGVGAGPASDVYSLGVVLYELLTGVRPFDGDNITAIAIAHVDRDPEPPSAHNPELGPATDALVLRMLAKDPNARFEDGTALAGALRTRHTAAGDAGATTAVAPAAAATTAAYAPDLAEASGDDEAESDDHVQRGRRPLASALAILLLVLATAGVLAATRHDAPPVAEAEAEAATESEAPKVSRTRRKPSPSPSVTEAFAATSVASTTPSPSPTNNTEKVSAQKKDEKKGKKDPPQDPKPEPDPTATDQPTTEPSPTSTPAQEPSPEPSV